MEQRAGLAAARWGIPLLLVVAWGCSAPATGGETAPTGSSDETVESAAFHGPATQDRARPAFSAVGDVHCEAGRTQCGMRCVDVDNDARNCGDCDATCAEGDICAYGRCTAPCSAGQTMCDDGCADTSTDARNCGGCGVVCAPGDTCVNGACTPPSGCPDGCPSAFQCVDGSCQPMCDHAAPLCGGICCPNHEWLCNNAGVCCQYAPCGDVCCAQGQACVNDQCQ